jgi:UDP-N-acetylmuramate--alanine ligase
VAGYDRSESRITQSLREAGCTITFDDDRGKLPLLFTDITKRDKVIIVYTPAIPAENSLISFFRDNNYTLFKRSEILGEISLKSDTLAVAGTHGKTTISTMTAHILKQSHVDCSAFLGGISKNYDTNLILGEGKYTVMEADEFDRSFLRLSPLMAVVSAVDPDHLEIYGDQKNMIVAYNEFCSRIRKGGTLIVNSRIRNEIACPPGVSCFTYGLEKDADFRSFDIERRDDYYSFNLKTPETVIKGLHFPFPGIINIENLTAAMAIALKCGVTESEIRKAIVLFQGVRRRFDIRINMPGLTFIDDYAHHPEEIKACLTSVKEYFGGRKITGIFQPHLFTRTLDHAAGFAEILDKLDEVILLPVYPARENPIPGVTSRLIFDRMKLTKKRLLEMEDIPGELNANEIDVLITIGAGNIDRLVEPIEKMLRSKRMK